jgi:hypothetical protein
MGAPSSSASLVRLLIREEAMGWGQYTAPARNTRPAGEIPGFLGEGAGLWVPPHRARRTRTSHRYLLSKASTVIAQLVGSPKL